MKRNEGCQLCGLKGPLANWERELHSEYHRVHPETITQKPLGFWKTIGWGILFASPFIIMCIMVAVIYE